MTQVATLPDPLAEVAPPKSRSGGAAWATWLARRLGLAVLTLWLVSVLVYVATAALGDPAMPIERAREEIWLVLEQDLAHVTAQQ